MVGGELRTLAILDKPDLMEGPYFEETILLTPSRLPDGVQREVLSCVQRSVAILGLDDGPVHAELRVDGERASLLEIAPRSIGGRCSTILRFEPEATLEELILHHALGMPIDEYSRAPGAGGVMMLPIPGSRRSARGGRVRCSPRDSGYRRARDYDPGGPEGRAPPRGQSLPGISLRPSSDAGAGGDRAQGRVRETRRENRAQLKKP